MKVNLFEWSILALIILVTWLPSMIIGFSTSKSIDTWYKELKKPVWNPPNWIFGPVWSVLYICMSVAVWLVWKHDPSYRIAFQLYLFQLLLNFTWSPIFFLLKKPGLAFLNILLLWAMIAITSLVFFFKVTLAAQLMMPYLAWVTFASLLNYRIWQDNR